MKTLKINEYDIILINTGKGQGKIIIAGPSLNTSFYWGSMGCELEEFICDIDSGYWLNKLLPLNVEKPLNAKKTFAAFRKQLYENLCDFGWWSHMEFQKEMREMISEKQKWCGNQYEFMDIMSSLPDQMPYYLIDDRYDANEIQQSIRNACSESWSYIVEGDSREAKLLLILHKELKKALKKELTNQPA